MLDKLGPKGAAAAVTSAIGGRTDNPELERRVSKALDRATRKSLEPLAKDVKSFDADALAKTIEQGAIRLAYLLSGDLGSALTNVRRRERIHVNDVGREDTSTGDLIRFALTQESIEMRRRLGIVWATAGGARA